MDRKATGLGYWKENRCPRQPPFSNCRGDDQGKSMGGNYSSFDRDGVGRITPLLTERTEVRMPSGKETEKLRSGGNWRSKPASNRVILGCRNRFSSQVQRIVARQGKQSFIASIRLNSASLWLTRNPPSGALLIIGPEGGWTDEEEGFALEKGAVPFSLGPNVLRTETAAVCALAVARAGFVD